MMRRHVFDSTGSASGKGQVPGSCENDIERSGSKNAGNYSSN